MTDLARARSKRTRRELIQSDNASDDPSSSLGLDSDPVDHSYDELPSDDLVSDDFQFETPSKAAAAAAAASTAGSSSRKKKPRMDPNAAAAAAAAAVAMVAATPQAAPGLAASTNSAAAEAAAAAAANKGLRHFSMRVCQKVKQKGVTSYNEVADELVTELSSAVDLTPAEKGHYDQKNIRRRVYDALNVLMAMNIIAKDKKSIRWMNFPTNAAHECEQLNVTKFDLMHRLKLKKEHMQELILQQVAFQTLVQRNKDAQEQKLHTFTTEILKLPFIVITTNSNTEIDCQMEEDRTEYFFNFKQAFEVHDDIEVLKRMGMARGLNNKSSTAEDLAAIEQLVDEKLMPYIEEMTSTSSSSSSSSAPPPPAPAISQTGSSARKPARKAKGRRQTQSPAHDPSTPDLNEDSD
ncbi:Tfdp2 protein [Capsaspora owczarzaki ATCC 30864]|uniref:Tfdp2 protein n=1 Tax=Capsaspora owczarzaki (strain ATCC 30864) TaxID=595528 RepID=A0A0D2WK72_CAPO3|nr:Tfdp2 protein [Capsaspora owczarzaki ATCC 30864]KJE89958.1 Tfdp2 protein [Capsaspora owczarzaki ATCC 30864]|eukprot:XP_004349872.2 Tfdp2 protein [Capsaspora owczarzaki ATCC 30864]